MSWRFWPRIGLRLKEKELAEVQLKEAKERRAADEAYGAALVAEAEAAAAQLEHVQLDIDALRTSAICWR